MNLNTIRHGGNRQISVATDSVTSTHPVLIRCATRIEAEDAGAIPNGFICAPETKKSTN